RYGQAACGCPSCSGLNCSSVLDPFRGGIATAASFCNYRRPTQRPRKNWARVPSGAPDEPCKFFRIIGRKTTCFLLTHWLYMHERWWKVHQFWAILSAVSFALDRRSIIAFDGRVMGGGTTGPQALRRPQAVDRAATASAGTTRGHAPRQKLEKGMWA